MYHVHVYLSLTNFSLTSKGIYVSDSQLLFTLTTVCGAYRVRSGSEHTTSWLQLHTTKKRALPHTLCVVLQNKSKLGVVLGAFLDVHGSVQELADSNPVLAELLA